MSEKQNIQIGKIDKSMDNYKYVYYSGCNKFNKIGNWLEKQSSIFKTEIDNKKVKKPNFKRGQIIKVDFGVNIGSELSNSHFAIVLNSDDNTSVDNLTVIPLTSKKGYKRLYIGNILKDFEKIKKYNNNGYALITQITTISKKRIINTNVRSYCTKEVMDKITKNVVEYLSN